MVAKSGSGGKSDTPPGRILRPEPTTQWPHQIASFRARGCFYQRIPLKIAPCTKGLFPVQRSSEMMGCTPYRRRGFLVPNITSVPECTVFYTECLRTGEACFLHRMSQKMRRVPQEPLYGTTRPFRTPGGPLRYRMLHRKKGERPCLRRIFQTARKEKTISEKRVAVASERPVHPRSRGKEPPETSSALAGCKK